MREKVSAIEDVGVSASSIWRAKPPSENVLFYRPRRGVAREAHQAGGGALLGARGQSPCVVPEGAGGTLVLEHRPSGFCPFMAEEFTRRMQKPRQVDLELVRAAGSDRSARLKCESAQSGTDESDDWTTTRSPMEPMSKDNGCSTTRLRRGRKLLPKR